MHRYFHVAVNVMETGSFDAVTVACIYVYMYICIYIYKFKKVT